MRINEQLKALPATRVAGVCGLVLIAWAWSVPAVGDVTAKEPHSFLRKHVGFTAQQIAAMDRGEVVTKVLPRGDRREVAVLGVVRLAGSPAALLERIRDIERYRKSNTVTAVGRFGVPPVLGDLARLTLDRDDLAALRDCKPGDCRVKLPVAMMERFRRDIDWAAPDADARATRLAKQMLVDYAKAYRDGGSGAMGKYHDRAHPQDMAAEFDEVLGRPPYLIEYVPELDRHLRQFPRGSLAGAEDFLYWAVEDFGLKPVVTLNHVTLYKPRRTDGRPPVSFIATRQIYASHYFVASLDLIA